MNKYAEMAQTEMVGQVDPWPDQGWWDELGERIETKVATIREQLLRSNSTLTCDQAQQRAEQEAIYWMVGVAYLGWEVPDEIHDQLWPTPQPLPTPSRLLHQIHNEERLA